MSQELEKLICKTLEENPGAELKFTRRVEARDHVVVTPANKVVITVEIQGGGRWLTCPMYEDCVHDAMPVAVECLRVSRAGDRLAAAAPKDDYVPTEAELAVLASRTELTCRSCANTGVDVGRGRCVCLDRLAPGG